MRIVIIALAAIFGMAVSSSALSPTLAPAELPNFPQDSVWINTKSLTRDQLKGKVVLYDFWTYSCINCVRTFPYLKAWYNRYHKLGLEIIGIHAPEFAFEREYTNVTQAITKYGITWPVVLDNDNRLWNLFHNRFWPAEYLYGTDGKILLSHFGEGNYEETEKAIQDALKKSNPDQKITKVQGESVGLHFFETPEIYLGYRRLEYAQNNKIAPDTVERYTAPNQLQRNHFAFDGSWKLEGEKAVTASPGSRIVLRYNARKVHIVAASPKKPIRLRLRIDGKNLPQAWAGEDAKNSIQFARLYRLVDTKKSESHLLEIIFEEPGVEVYTFTFG